MTPYSSHHPSYHPSHADPHTEAREHAEQEKQEQRVNAVMREMEQHGEHLAAWANRLATMLLAVFSTASLLSLSLAAFNAFMAQLAAGRLDIPDALSVLLNLLLVLAMDMAMFYAASVIRAVASAGGAGREIAVHVLVMVTASALETATYIYLVVQYDRPTNAWLWAIGIGRGIAAPLFATYLSLARKLPVAPRDIAYYVALLSGRGVVHDVAVMAADRHAPLHRKVNIYTAAATMAAAEHAKFARIIAAVEPEPAPQYLPQNIPQDKRQEEPTPQPAPERAPERAPSQPPAPDLPEPQRQSERPAQPTPAPTPIPSRQPQREPQRELVPAANVEVSRGQRSPQTVRRTRRRGLDATGYLHAVTGAPDAPEIPETPDRLALRLQREAAARRILDEHPNISMADLARQIAIATKRRTGESTARNLRDAIRFAPTVDAGDDGGEGDAEQRRN